jgi:hypothetical protein
MCYIILESIPEDINIADEEYRRIKDRSRFCNPLDREVQDSGSQNYSTRQH